MILMFSVFLIIVVSMSAAASSMSQNYHKNKSREEVIMPYEYKEKLRQSNPYLVKNQILTQERSYNPNQSIEEGTAALVANYCRFCGSKIDPDAVFCHQCGIKL